MAASRRLGLVVFALTLTLVTKATISQAASFFYKKLADTTDTFSSFGARPSLNNQGEAAWYGVKDDGVFGVFAGDGQLTRAVVTSETPGVTSIDETPDINDQGYVASLVTDSAGEKVVFVTDENGNHSSYLDTTGFLTNIGTRVKVSSSPVDQPIATGRGLFNGGENIWRSNGALTTTIATTTGTNYRQFSSSVIAPTNPDWTAARATLVNNQRNIYSFHGTTPTLIAGTANGFSNVTVSDINSQGVVAGLAEFPDGSAKLFTGNGGPLTTIADTSIYASFSDGPGINESGDSAFGAMLTNGREGIFTGDGDRIGLTGIHIDGRNPDDFSVHPQGFNERGQTVFRVRFDDGVEAIYRADPVATPPAPTASSRPQLPSGSRKLVLITHGWAGSDPDDNATHQWMNEMKSNIEQRIAELPDSEEWEVGLYLWTRLSGHPRHSDTLDFRHLYNHTVDNGRELGQEIARQDYEHVHLIAYSAGPALIDEAARQIKRLSDNNPVVHLTSLDALVPFLDPNFGSSSDWSEQYMSDGFFDLPFTQTALPNTHNVRVDKLGSRYSDHDGPRLFYSDSAIQSIPGTAVPDSDLLYGFNLSREGGGWSGTQPPNLQPNAKPIVLGAGADRTLPPTTGPGSVVPISPELLSYATSETGEVAVSQNGIDLRTGSPVWIVLRLDLDSRIDLLSFSVDFLDQGIGAGILSASLDGNLIGSVDGFYSPGQEERLQYLLSGAEPGIHELAFRLDSPTNSIARIFDISVSALVPIPEPSAIEILLSGGAAFMFSTNRLRRCNRRLCWESDTYIVALDEHTR